MPATGVVTMTHGACVSAVPETGASTGTYVVCDH